MQALFGRGELLVEVLDERLYFADEVSNVLSDEDDLLAVLRLAVAVNDIVP